MHIAPATMADVPALCDLLRLLFAQEADFTPDAEAQRRGLTRIIEDRRTGTILVARRQGRIVGMVNLLYTVSTALGERVAILEDMVIAPDQRGLGIGSHLLELALEHARAEGCRRITLLTDRSNESAQRFYARHGFQASAMVPLRVML